MEYKNIFLPKQSADPNEPNYHNYVEDNLIKDFRTPEDKQEVSLVDRRDGKVYCYTEEIILAINVALATGRPLLLRGKSGCGKSALAYNVARVLNRRYYEYVVTSRSQARDLLWRFDAVRRLGDAQAQIYCPPSNKEQNSTDQLSGNTLSESIKKTTNEIPYIWKNYHPYIQPGILWWVFDYESAKHRGADKETLNSSDYSSDIAAFTPSEIKDEEKSNTACVILLDEIDKADPDFANNLLVPLGSLQFTVDELQGQKICFQKAQKQGFSTVDLPLVIITTNEERRLPQAFLRRCVVLEIKQPQEKQELIQYLVTIAEATETNGSSVIYEEIAKSMYDLSIKKDSKVKNINVAEYLDAVRAYSKLISNKEIHEDKINELIKITVWKGND